MARSSKTISASADIARSAAEVFDYVADATHLPEWQPDVRQAAYDGTGDVSVGTRGHEVRHVMGADRTIGWEVTEYDAPRRYAIRGIDGPVRAHVTMTMTPERDTTRLAYDIEFEGRGIGRLFAVMARKGASAEVPASIERLKQQLTR